MRWQIKRVIESNYLWRTELLVRDTIFYVSFIRFVRPFRNGIETIARASTRHRS